MNKVILVGKITKNPEIRYISENKNSVVARYTIAVERIYQKKTGYAVDFIRCETFGKNALFAEKYFYEGLKVCISGQMRTGHYVNKEGRRIYTTNILVETQEFFESPPTPISEENREDINEFMEIPDDMDDVLPFR